MGVVGFLREREYGGQGPSQFRRCKQDVSDWLERLAAAPALNQPCEISGEPKATFLMDFSPDKTKMASSHGDHTVRVTEIATGKCTHILTGHPRTPWCLAFHPSHNEILASGCLGGQVRIWDLRGGGSEVFNSDSHSVIASLTFHPTDNVLVFSAKNMLYFWDWTLPKPFICCATNHDYESVRWVKFDTFGHYLYTGICNGTDIPRDYETGYRRDQNRESSRSDSRSTYNPTLQQRLAANQQRYMMLLGVGGFSRQQRADSSSGSSSSSTREREHPTSPVHEDRLRQAFDYARYVTSHSQDNDSWIRLSARRAQLGRSEGSEQSTSSQPVPPYNMFRNQHGRPQVVANSPPPRPLQDSDSDSDDIDMDQARYWQVFPAERGRLRRPGNAAVGSERSASLQRYGSHRQQRLRIIRDSEPPLDTPSPHGEPRRSITPFQREVTGQEPLNILLSALNDIANTPSVAQPPPSRTTRPSASSLQQRMLLLFEDNESGRQHSNQDSQVQSPPHIHGRRWLDTPVSGHSSVGASSATVPLAVTPSARTQTAADGALQDRGTQPASLQQASGVASTPLQAPTLDSGMLSGQTSCPDTALPAPVASLSALVSVGDSGSSQALNTSCSLSSAQSLRSSSVSSPSAFTSAFQTVVRPSPAVNDSASVSREAETACPLTHSSDYANPSRGSSSGEASASGDIVYVSASNTSSTATCSAQHSLQNVSILSLSSLSFPMDCNSSGASSTHITSAVAPRTGPHSNESAGSSQSVATSTHPDSPMLDRPYIQSLENATAGQRTSINSERTALEEGDPAHPGSPLLERLNLQSPRERTVSESAGTVRAPSEGNTFVRTVSVASEEGDHLQTSGTIRDRPERCSRRSTSRHSSRHGASSSSNRSDGTSVRNEQGAFDPDNRSCTYLFNFQRNIHNNRSLRESVNHSIEEVRLGAHVSGEQWTCDFIRTAAGYLRCPICRTNPVRQSRIRTAEHRSMSMLRSTLLSHRYLDILHGNATYQQGRTTDGTSQTSGQLNEPEHADCGTDMVDLSQLERVSSQEINQEEASGSAESQHHAESDLERQLFENDDEISRIQTSYRENMLRLAEDRNRILSTLRDRGSSEVLDNTASVSSHQPLVMDSSVLVSSHQPLVVDSSVLVSSHQPLVVDSSVSVSSHQLSSVSVSSHQSLAGSSLQTSVSELPVGNTPVTCSSESTASSHSSARTFRSSQVPLGMSETSLGSQSHNSEAAMSAVSQNQEDDGPLHTLPSTSRSNRGGIEVITGMGVSETISFSELARRVANREDVTVVGNHRRVSADSRFSSSATALTSGEQRQGQLLRSCLASSNMGSSQPPAPVPPPMIPSPPMTLPTPFSTSVTSSAPPIPPRILVQRPSSEDQPQGSQDNADQGPGGMLLPERRNLHPHYARSVLDNAMFGPSFTMQSSINSAIAGIFMSSGEQAVASNIVPGTYRIQRWDFRQQQIPDLTEASANIVVGHCKIHNDASIDLSRDSSLLATFVHNHGGFPDENVLGVFSLHKESFGQCLYTKSFGPNAISVSLSPSNQHMMVGLASKRMLFIQVSDQLVGQIFKMVKVGAGEDSMMHVTDVYHPVRRRGLLMRGMSPVSVNSARWLPNIGEGIVYGTNHGDLHLFRSGRTRAGIEEEEAKPRKLTISTQTGTGIIRRSAFTQTSEEHPSH